MGKRRAAIIVEYSDSYEPSKGETPAERWETMLSKGGLGHVRVEVHEDRAAP